TGFHSSARWFILWLEVSELEKAIVNVSAELENIKNKIIDGITVLQEEVSPVNPTALQNRMALGRMLASQGAVCTGINTSCCVQVDQSGRVTTHLQ
ncbi:ERVV2 protein, partial [Pterocles burchelli]|nr:ERVV2 protein [Pterocles burchelli]